METPTLDYLNSMANGDDVFIQEILGVIQEELPVEHDEYCNHIDGENWEGAADLVHKIKHKFTIFGLESSVALANRHEKDLRDKSPVFHNQFNDLIDLIRKFVKDKTT